MTIFENIMATLRRRKLILLFGFGITFFSATILISYYTSLEHKVEVIEDDALLLNEAAYEASLRGNGNDEIDLFDRFISGTGIQNDEASLKNLEVKMKTRTRRVETVCEQMKKRNLSPPNQPLYRYEDLKHLIVNKDHQILYCYLPKVANTNFRRVFLGLQGNISLSAMPTLSGYEIYFKYDKSFTFVKSFKPKEQSELLRQYKKFLFVRDPLERLLSGYRNKFFHPNAKHKAEYHDRVISFYRLHPHLRRRNKIRMDFSSKEMTFKEFMMYWTDAYEINEYLNEHFVPSNQLCNPCDIHYDYIGKYETLETDVRYIFKRLKIDIEFPGRNDNYSSTLTSTLVETYYTSVPDWLLKKAWEIIKFDYLLFGYRLPDWYRRRLQ